MFQPSVDLLQVCRIAIERVAVAMMNDVVRRQYLAGRLHVNNAVQVFAAAVMPNLRIGDIYKSAACRSVTFARTKFAIRFTFCGLRESRSALLANDLFRGGYHR